MTRPAGGDQPRGQPGSGGPCLHVGTDVGGTFTDLWALSEDGRQVVVKTPSSPDIVTGILRAVGLAASHLGLTPAEFCGAVGRFGHGTTAGLNALLTGHTAKTAIITTAGFGDTLEIGRLKRQVAGLTELQLGDYAHRGRWPPVVPRRLVFEIRERIDRNGGVVVPLEESSVAQVLEQLDQAGIEAVAVCTLWSVLNPVHELRIAELLAQRLPQVFVTLSHVVAPGIGEYARMSTTAANAALGPVLGRYLAALDQALGDRGLTVPVHVMTSAGGVVPAAQLAREPVAALMSGPAAGVMASQRLGEILGHDRILTIDVGGTSFDVGVIAEGAPPLRDQITVAGADIHRLAIDVGSIGAGGGSIARAERGALLVGPQSAGADPGPVCYGRGGTRVTATDADLVLGILGEEGFAGGSIRPSRAAAEAAIREQIACPLGMSVLEAAWGVRQVLDSKMADLLRSVTIERGHDPREFVMFASGGQGPSHAWALCRELGIATFVVTATATAHSALGTGTSDLRHSAERPCFVRIPPGADIPDEGLARLTAGLTAAEKAARGRLSNGPAGGTCATGPAIERWLALRYRGQSHHLHVAVYRSALTGADFAEAVARFETRYESLFGPGSAFREAGLEVLSARVIVTAPLPAIAVPKPSGDLAIAGSRPVIFDDPSAPVECALWTTEFPAAGHRIEGPALVTYPGHTLVVPPTALATTDGLGNFVVRMDPPSDSVGGEG